METEVRCNLSPSPTPVIQEELEGWAVAGERHNGSHLEVS